MMGWMGLGDAKKSACQTPIEFLELLSCTQSRPSRVISSESVWNKKVFLLHEGKCRLKLMLAL